MRTKLMAPIVAFVVSAGLLTASAASASAEQDGGLDVGVTFHALWEEYTDDAVRTAVFDKLAAARIGWIRVDVGWVNLEPTAKTKGNWYVDRLTRTVNEASARGMKVLCVLFMTPEWANGGQAPSVPPTNVADYARVAGWAAKKFKGKVAAWEIWNEPTDEHFWEASPARYAEMARAAYPAIKAADAKATVVVGSTIYNDDRWLAKAYDAGLHGAFDAIATHPYMGPLNSPPELVDNGKINRMDHVRAVRKLMVDRGDGDKPIWFTEFGWTAHDDMTPETPPWEWGVTEAEQADYLIRALQMIEREYAYVSHAFWYNERNKNQNSPKEDNAGLLRQDLSEKPVYQALRAYLDPARVVPATTTSTLATEWAAPRSRPSTSDSPLDLLGRVWWLGFLIPLAAGAVRRHGARRRFILLRRGRGIRPRSLL